MLREKRIHLLLKLLVFLTQVGIRDPVLLQFELEHVVVLLLIFDNPLLIGDLGNVVFGVFLLRP